MTIDTGYLVRCIRVLDGAFRHLQTQPPGGTLSDIYRAACVKEFEIILEHSGTLLKKRLRPFFAGNPQADRLTFKDAFRYAAKHGLITEEQCERWLEYRNVRNVTAHEYGKQFAAMALTLVPGFITDAEALADVIAEDVHD